MKKTSYILIAMLCALSFWGSAEAATLQLRATPVVQVGQQVVVDVLLDPEGVAVNSFDIGVTFPQDNFRFGGYAEKQSQVSLWITVPKEETDGTIRLTGLIPGGVERLYDPEHPQNKSLLVARLLFISLKPADSAPFVLSRALVLKNDGKGTAVAVDATNDSVKITDVPSGQKQQVIMDTDTPDPFTISVIPGSLFGSTPRLAIFATQDNTSGVEKYEAAINGGTFKIVTSPYSLPRRLFSYTFTVRAADYYGNTREQSITVPGMGYAPLILLIGAGIGVLFYIRKKKR